MSSQADDAANGASSATSKIRHVLEHYRLPGLNLDAFIQARQDDINAISKATSIAFSGAQTIGEKQMELLKATLDRLSAAIGSTASAVGEGTSPGEIGAQQRALVQDTLTRTLDDMKQMAEAAQRAQMEIFEIALERARSNADQLRGLFSRKA
jgi:phasin family protein